MVSSGTDLVKTSLKVLFWSEVWFGSELQTNGAGSLATMFLKMSDGLISLSMPCHDMGNLVMQIVEPSSPVQCLGAGYDGLMSSVGLTCLVAVVAFGCVEVG